MVTSPRAHSYSRSRHNMEIGGWDVAAVFAKAVTYAATLGAAGAVEAIVCLLALQHQFLPPNINFHAPDEDADLNIVANESRPASLHTVLSNSFGFGGTNASLIMQKFEA